MPSANPFSTSVFADDLRFPPEGNAPLNEAARAQLCAEIEALTGSTHPGPGRLLRLRAPAAGYGKSHLLARVVADCSERSHALPVVFNLESAPSWSEMFRQAIKQLSESCRPNTLSPLSETARLVFAELVGELIQRGVVPAEDPQRAIHSLQKNYRTVFDLQNPQSPIISWFRENAKALATPLAGALHHRTGLDQTASCFWVDFFYRFETLGPQAISDEIFEIGEGEAKSRMRDLGKLVSRYRPLVMIFDHLDAFYRDADAGLQAAYLFSEIARIGVSPLCIIAINDDFWQSNFANRIPSAIADRLSDSEVALSGLTLEEGDALIEERIRLANIDGSQARQFNEQFNLRSLFEEFDTFELSARALLKFAAAAWGGTARTLQANTPPPGMGASEIAHLPAGAGETLNRIKGMLRDVNERKPAKAGEENTDDPDRRSPWNPPSEEAPTVVKVFAEQRDSLFFGDRDLFDPAAIRRTLTLAGQRSPLIDYDEIQPGDGPQAAVWRSPDQEILIGFAPAEQTPYWRDLVERSDASTRRNSKVVAFSSSDAVSAFSLEKLNGHAREHLDILELDRSALASIAAADAVVSRADSAEQAFGQISPELDFLWKRVTRPLGENA